MNAELVSNLGNRIIENIKKVIVGKDEIIKLCLVGILSEGHILLEDVPGTGKTMLAKSLAASIDGEFKRIQSTPDLLPSDITGSSVYNQSKGVFDFRPGAVFSNVLLADELNRATPRTQSALLESMEEHQVSSDGNTYDLPKPFFVIATQNPIETQGTFPLPEAQLDRFLFKLSLGYPKNEETLELLNRYLTRAELINISAVSTADEIINAQNEIKSVEISKEVQKYIVDLAEKSRTIKGVKLGISTRGTIALMRSSQALAALDGRNFVTPDDVKYLMPHVFSHRMIIEHSMTNRQEKIDETIRQIIDGVKVPTEVIK